jgi:hypothetical protein
MTLNGKLYITKVLLLMAIEDMLGAGLLKYWLKIVKGVIIKWTSL